ncbi:hydrogenase 3 maturation endopeptidase HyCI [[Eubacterium] cellulosolvens]
MENGEQSLLKMVLGEASIRRRLKKFFRDSIKITLIGVGNILRRDDALGIEVIKEVKKRVGKSDMILMIESHTTPENYFGLLEQEKPSHILFIDAADAHFNPGTIFLTDIESAEGLAVSTHSIPLSVYSEFIHTLIKTEILFFGIQPGDISFGEGLTSEVKTGIERAVDILASSLPS